MAVLYSWIFLITVLGTNLVFVLSSPFHFVTLPNVIRLETDEVVTVTSMNSVGDVAFRVYLQSYPDREKIISEKNVTVPEEEVVNVTVRMGVEDLPIAPPSPMLVFLVVETTNWRKEATLLVNDSPGFIFIQTDKPLYTPDQSILTRVIPLDDAFRPVQWPVQVDIQNPDGMTISRKVVTADHYIISDSLKIPETPVYGNWTVTAKFANGLNTRSDVRFEVKEYVLPRFAVTFHIPEDKRVILPNATHVTVAVAANYMYGKPVRGHATLIFGLLWHGHVFTVAKQRNLQLNESGIAECRISVEELRLPVQSVWFPNGGKLHLEAKVTETASGRVQKAGDVSVVFAEHMHVIKFTRSSRYFKPGLTYVLEIDVFKANGGLGQGLDLYVDCQVDFVDGETSDLPPKYPELPLRTDDRGKLTIEFDVPRDATHMLFKVSPRYSMDDQSSFYFFHARPAYSPSGVFMHTHAILTAAENRGNHPVVGDLISVTAKYTSGDDIDFVNILVLAHGHIVWQARTRNIHGDSTTFHFTLTQAMTPGVRILTFAIKGRNPGSEVISDSVWLDVLPQCEGEISMTLEDQGRGMFRPRDIGSVTLRGQPHTLVGLVAVDSAVYHLTNASLTREKMFQKRLSHDRGCGKGGGKDAAKIFQNAGLTVLTNAGLEIPAKLAEGCVDKMVRRRRDTTAQRSMRTECCVQGVKVQKASLGLCYFISTRLRSVTNAICAREFYTCCRDAVHGALTLDMVRGRQLTMEDREPPNMEIHIGQDGQLVNFHDIPLRTNFPESWWFEEYDLGDSGEREVDFVLPDSITSWSIHALGVSKGAGLCIAPPLQVSTFRSFFVHLDMPYSVVRLEQLELRATVYNYMSRRLRVQLVLMSYDGVCNAGQPEQYTDIVRLDIPAHDAASTYFPIVPMEIGEFPIKVYAFSPWGKDGVEKTLRVVGEGIEKIHTVSVMLDPSGKRFLRSRSSNHSFTVKNEVRVAEKRQSVELDLDLPQEVIPDTDKCTVHAMGDLIGPTLKVLVEGVGELLRLPTGCGEQNLIYLGPNVYVTRYLQATKRLSSSLEKKALALIRQGVARQMTFRKPDASYGTWPHAESSTWLTAFAMKTLCQAEHYVTLEHNQTCESFNWIASRQNEDGSFKEETWVTHREMLGGVNGDVTHAAFILVALLECDCPGQRQHEVVEKALQFVESRVMMTDRPLAVAISAYGLTLANSNYKDQAVKRLENLAKSSPDGFTYWSPGSESDFVSHEKPYWYAKKPGALAVEVTSYGLLTFLARGDITTATSIIGWLMQQRNSHGAFVSTQDTVIGLQALSEYSIKSYSAILDMTCHIRSEVDTRFRKSISLTPEDAMVLKSVPKVPTGGKLHFEAEGTGVGLMQVEVRFNVPDGQDDCRYEVKVMTRRHNTLLKTFFGESKSKCEPCDLDCTDDDYDYDDDEDEEDFENFTFPSIIPRIQRAWDRKEKYEREEGVWEEEEDRWDRWDQVDSTVSPSVDNPYSVHGSKIGRPSRRYRRSTQSFSTLVLCIEVCVRFLGNKTTGMSVLDVGLFTGFEPVHDDLELLKSKGVIDHFEKSQRSVVLYIDEVSSQETSCFKFRARQIHVADNLQPAMVQVYDYYNPDDRCTTFYKNDNSSGQVANFCDDQKQICECLESRCSYCEESWYGLRWMDMTQYACLNATYSLEIKALDRDLEKASFERVLAHVEEVHAQRGPHTISKGDKVILLKRSSCICPRLTPGKTYFLMLSTPKRFKDTDGHIIYAFLLDKNVFAVEHRKPKQKDLTGEQRATARHVKRTMRRLKRRGCRLKKTKSRSRSKRQKQSGTSGSRGRSRKRKRGLGRRHRRRFG